MIERITHIHPFSPTTVKLLEALQHGKPGDEKTDDELRVIAGMDCSTESKGYGYLASAIRRLRRYGVIWERVRGADKIRCLNAAERIETFDTHRRHIKRTAQKSLQILGSVDSAELPESERLAHRTKLATMGTLAMCAGKDFEKKMEASGIVEVPPVKNVLDFFKKLPSRQEP